MARDKVEVTEEDVEEEGPKQTVSRMPPEATAGPFFPSGMSAPEAAMAGATANMSDEEVEKIEDMKYDHGIETAVTSEDDGE